VTTTTAVYFTADLSRVVGLRVPCQTPPTNIWTRPAAGDGSLLAVYLLTPRRLAVICWQVERLEQAQLRGEYDPGKLEGIVTAYLRLRDMALAHGMDPAELTRAWQELAAGGGPRPEDKLPKATGKPPVTPWDAAKVKAGPGPAGDLQPQYVPRGYSGAASRREEAKAKGRRQARAAKAAASKLAGQNGPALF
jgi:hypothetical protein